MGIGRERVIITDDDQFSNNNLSKLMNLLHGILRFLLGALKPSLTNACVCYVLI